MIRERIANLLPFFIPREAPERAAAPEDALDIHAASQQVDSAYERFRNLLDPGDEDVLRRKAIARFLVREWPLASDPRVFSLALLKDLARGRYIPATTHRRYAGDLAGVVERAFAFWQGSGRAFPDQFIPLVAVELDRVLYPREEDDALVYVMYEEVRDRVVWEDRGIDAADRDTQLFLACHRALANTDEAELFWHLFRTAEPAWANHPSAEALRGIAERFPAVQGEIVATLHHPAAVRLLRRMYPLAVPYRILRDILRQEDAEAVLTDPARLAAVIRSVLARRIDRLEGALLKRVWHAAAFLFLTKGILAFATEIPYELFLGGIRWIPMTVNLLFPPTLLFLMAGSVPRPGRGNTERLVEVITGIVTGEGERERVVVRPSQWTAFRRSAFTLVYAIFTVAILAGILWVLQALHFSLVGGFFFLVFLGLVSFLGIRLRSAVREVRVVAPQPGFLSAMLDFFTLPILDVGRELAIRARQINVFLFLLDAVIEAPFKVLVGIIEEWFAYLRERKEELV